MTDYVIVVICFKILIFVTTDTTAITDIPFTSCFKILIFVTTDTTGCV